MTVLGPIVMSPLRILSSQTTAPAAIFKLSENLMFLVSEEFTEHFFKVLFKKYLVFYLLRSRTRS